MEIIVGIVLIVIIVAVFAIFMWKWKTHSRGSFTEAPSFDNPAYDSDDDGMFTDSKSSTYTMVPRQYTEIDGDYSERYGLDDEEV